MSASFLSTVRLAPSHFSCPITCIARIADVASTSRLPMFGVPPPCCGVARASLGQHRRPASSTRIMSSGASSHVRAAQLPSLTAFYKTAGIASGQPAPSSSEYAPYVGRYEAVGTLNDRVAVWRGDITQLEVDAIVNAANGRLLGGGGVDGAIHRAAGHELLAECRTLGGCATGDAKVTRGYRLPAPFIIHTVGPIYFQTGPAEAARDLASCYRNSLRAAVAKKCRSVAFCSISTGVYGFPAVPASLIATSTVRDFLAGPDGDKIDKVVFVVFDAEDLKIYEATLPVIFPPVA